MIPNSLNNTKITNNEKVSIKYKVLIYSCKYLCESKVHNSNERFKFFNFLLSDEPGANRIITLKKSVNS